MTQKEKEYLISCEGINDVFAMAQNGTLKESLWDLLDKKEKGTLIQSVLYFSFVGTALDDYYELLERYSITQKMINESFGKLEFLQIYDDVCYVCDGCGWVYSTQDQPPSGEGEQLCPDCCEDDEEDEEGEEF